MEATVTGRDGEAAGADVEFIKALYNALSFVYSLLGETSGVNLSMPSGCILNTNKAWEVLREYKYKLGQFSAVVALD